MAFPNPPKTWSAAAVLTAAQLNAELRDALNALLPLNVVAGTNFTPTLTQSGAVTKTVTRAKYFRFGNWVIALYHLTVTGTGTANNAITVSLPVTAAYAANAHCGAGRIFATTNFPGIACLTSTTTAGLLDTTTSTTGVFLGQTGSAATGALANTNEVHFWIGYEV